MPELVDQHRACSTSNTQSLIIESNTERMPQAEKGGGFVCVWWVFLRPRTPEDGAEESEHE